VAHADIVASTLSFAANEKIVCGRSLGYADPDSPVNRLVTERAAVAEFATFVED
jgi:hypothetical protein